MVRYEQTGTADHLRQILALQRLNLPANLSQQEMRSQGFLTVEHTFSLLKAMHDVVPHTMAVHQNEVVGYALSMHPKFVDEIEVLRSMFVEIKKAMDKNDRYLVMGQICVAKDYRGQGVFRGLYTHMQLFLTDRFDKIITEVDVKNVRSMQAHKAVGFRELKRYRSGDKEWSLIVF